jgi:NhaA family Na+:H+ antiporter
MDPPASARRPRRQVFADRLLAPMARFLSVEAASGLGLLAAAALALAWANSPWSATYDRMWHTPVAAGISLHAIVDDGLMTLFFLVAGLEIRCELHDGTLADRRGALLPIAAALGGMVAPALLFVACNHGGSGLAGWGVPMATDIAFAVGVLALAGSRVPAALRAFLLALAIIDDVGAIVVIALFYSHGFAIVGLGIAAAGVGGLLAMQRFGVTRALAYVVPGAVVWWGIRSAGIHPTIAGVVLGLVTPAVAARPVQAALHPWVAYGIMPLFALANAGVDLRGFSLERASVGMLFGGVTLGLVVGKPLGIVAAAAVAVRLRLGALPPAMGWRGLVVVGVIAGIGFTMAIFIAGLAFADDALLSTAKAGVLLSSLLAGVLGLVLVRLLLPPPRYG